MPRAPYSRPVYLKPATRQEKPAIRPSKSVYDRTPFGSPIKDYKDIAWDVYEGAKEKAGRGWENFRDFMGTDVDVETTNLPGGQVAAPLAILSRKFLKKFAKETGEEAHNLLKSSGAHMLSEEVPKYIEKHYAPYANVSEFILDPDTPTGAVQTAQIPYGRHLYELAEDIVKKRPVPELGLRSYQDLINQGMSEEDIERFAKRMISKFKINPEMENMGKAQLYETLRHEASHLSDIALRPSGTEGTLREGARYWPSLAETRARAVQRNYLRDLGMLSGNQQMVIDPKTGLSVPKRIPYSQKIQEELETGAKFGYRDVANETYGDVMAGRTVDPREFVKNVKDVGLEARGTMEHYFGPRTAVGKQPRLRPTVPNWETDFLRRISPSGSIFDAELGFITRRP